ncbi:MAG: hypothetical protein JWR36_690 [Glaciihabitans sp.]|nr:hypothetical protein [Glaciihabitans sp.]
MRAIPDSLDANVVLEIDRRIAGIETEHRVIIPWAIESGSRAWGFPSPDSDYDCRFFYVRARSDYLSLWPASDVIDTPLDKIFDVNGWDLAKAIRLLVNGNAVVAEWLQSDIVYSGDAQFRKEFLDLAHEITDRGRVGRHYEHVASQHLERATLPSGANRLKRLFYALRPAAAVRWLRVHPDSAVPPMSLTALVRESDAPSDVIDATDELIELKSRLRESQSMDAPDILRRFVESEIAAAGSAFDHPERISIAEARARAQQFFHQTVNRLEAQPADG